MKKGAVFSGGFGKLLEICEPAVRQQFINWAHGMRADPLEDITER